MTYPSANTLSPMEILEQELQKEEWWKLLKGVCQKVNPIIGYVQWTYEDFLCRAHIRYDGKYHIRNPTEAIREHQYDREKAHLCGIRDGRRIRLQWSRKDAVSAVLTITEIVSATVEQIDQYIDEKEKEALEFARFSAHCDKVVAQLGARVEADKYERTISFRMGRNYQLEAELDETKAEVCNIKLRGTYTTAQMKELIEFLASCPQAVAERVLHQ